MDPPIELKPPKSLNFEKMSRFIKNSSKHYNRTCHTLSRMMHEKKSHSHPVT